MGVAPATDGRIYLAQNSRAYPVLVFDRAGRFLTSWGAGQFTAPHGCRIGPDGSVWLTDNADHRVLKFTPNGRLLAAFGVRGKPGADASHFNRPADIAFGPDGTVYVADGYGNARVVRLSPEGRYLGAWGRHGTGRGEFHLVHGVVVAADGRVYVADRDNQRLQIFTPTGRCLAEWDHVGTPFGLALTPDRRRLFVADGIANTIRLYDLTGRLLTHWGGTGSAPGQFRRAHLCGVDSTDGALYVTEVYGRRMQKFTASPIRVSP